MAQNAEQVLTNVIVTNPKDIVAIFSNQDGGIGVSWSDMDIDRLCYLKEVFNMALQGRINQAFNLPKSSKKVTKLQSTRDA